MYENEIKNQKRYKKRIKILFLRVCLMAMLLILSTYAWFTSQKDITLSNIRGTVEVVENMEISLDAKSWYQEIDLKDAPVTFSIAQDSRNQALGETESENKSTALAIVPNQLFPVSGVGEAGYTLMPMYMGEARSTSLNSIEKCLEETKNDSNVDVAVDNGYFAFDIYIKNTSRDDEPDVLQLNINSAAQVLTEAIRKNITDESGNEVQREYVGNDASGLQNTIRVALALYEGEVSSTATQLEILNSTKVANIQDIAIWEPNAYDHVESIVANNNKLINETEANPIPFTNGEVVDTYALNGDALGVGNIENVYNIKSEGLGLQNTLKTDNIKDEITGEVLTYRIKTTDSKPINITTVAEENSELELKANTVSRLRIYVWLEGQDVDCINVASLGGGIELDLGLTKDDEIGDIFYAKQDENVLNVSTGDVTATISANREIAVLPTEWEYANPTKTAITKIYSINTIENVPIQAVNGDIVSVKVKIEEVDKTLSEQIAGDEAIYYGYYTDYPIDIDNNTGNNDWRILYNNGTNIFLIADKYVPNTMLTDEVLTALGMKRHQSYSVNWSNPANLTYTITDNEYMISEVESFTTTNQNYKMAASLLATQNWEAFKDSNFADSAVGGATLEMWIASWNTVYDSENYPNEQLYYAADTEGYYIGTTSEPTSLFVRLNNFNGYNNTLYYPYKSVVDGCQGYWLAAPSMADYRDLLRVEYDSRIYDGIYNRTELGLRPVVCLNAEVGAIKVGNVWKLVSP